jgi:hypothetical protein
VLHFLLADRHRLSHGCFSLLVQTTATCPAGTHLIGTGGEVVGGAGEVVLDDLRADTVLTKTTVTDSRTTPAWTPTGA